MSNKPYEVEFPSNGSLEWGYLGIAENERIPFTIQRTFWAFHTPNSVTRGRHAHHETEMILIAVAGWIELSIETIEGDHYTYKLEDPKVGVYIPKLAWHTMKYSHNAVQLVLASTTYNENDYIRDYDAFKELQVS